MSNESKPMDATIKEQAVGTMSPNAKRVCYALRTLVAEVTELFPETAVEYSNYDGRNTALAAVFDLSLLNYDDFLLFSNLFSLLIVDPRVSQLASDVNEQSAFISMLASARTQDSREPFGLAVAMSVLAEDMDNGYDGDLLGGSW